MASETDKIIKIIFEGVDKTSGTIKTIGSDIEDFGSSVSDIAAPLADLGNSILTIDKYLAGLAIGGLALASHNAIKYKDSVADLNKVMTEGETLTDEMKKQQKDLASTYGIATTAIIDSQAGLQQSGYNAAQSFDILGTSVKLAASSELSATESTELLKKALIGYELEAKDAIAVADLWNLTANKSSTDVKQLAEGFTIVARQASDAGFSMEELTAGLTPIIGVFGSGAEAGNAFSITLGSLANPTKKTTEAINKLLGTSGPLNEQYKTTADLFKAISKAFKDLPPSQKGATAALIVGKEQAKRATLAFSDFEKELTKVDAASRKVGESLDKEVKIALEQTSTQVNILKVAFTDFFTSIGLQYDKELSGVVKGLSGVFKGFEIAVNDDAFKPLFDLIRSSGVEMSTLLEQIAKNLPEAFKSIDFKGITESLDSLKKNIFSIFDDTDLSTADGLAKAIQFVVDSIDSLIRVTDGILEAWQPLFDAIGKGIDAFNGMDKATKEAFGNLLGISQQLVFFGGGLAATGLVVKAFGIGLKALASPAKAIGPLFTSISAAVSRISQQIILANAGVATSAALTVAASAALVTAAGIVGAAIGTLINQIPGVQRLTQELFAIGDKDFKFTLGETEEDLKNKTAALEKYRSNIAKFREETAKKIKIEVDENSLTELQKNIIKAVEEIKLTGSEIFGEKIALQVELDKKQARKDFIEAYGIIGDEKEVTLNIIGNIELDKKAKESLSSIEKIDDKLRELSARKNEIEVIAQFKTAKGEVTPNELALEFDAINKEIDNLTSTKKEITLELNDNDTFNLLKTAEEDLDRITKEENIIRLQSEVNEGEGFGEVVDELQILEDGSWKVTINPKLEGVEEVKEKVDELTKDKEFLLKIKTKEIEEATKRIVATTKANAEIIQANLEYTAKIEIKELELQETKITKLFDGISNTISVVTQSTNELFGAFSQDFDQRSLWLWRDQLRQNAEIQKTAADDQHELNKALIEQLKLRNRLAEKMVDSDSPIRLVYEGGGEPLVEEFFRYWIPKLQLFGLEKNIPVIINTLT